VRAALIAVLAVLVAATAASAGSAAPAIKSFKLQGGKVECVVVGGSAPSAGVLCVALLEPGVKPFPKPVCDAGDPGGGLSIGLTGKATGICLSENPFVPPVKLLAYGSLVTIGGMSCAAISKAVGVRCENATGHGFRMSPTGWKRF
jgi:hypothetical protein